VHVRQPPPTPGITPGEGRILRAMKSQHLAITALRRQLSALEVALARPGDPAPRTKVLATSASYADASPAISVVVPVYNHRETVREALDSVADCAYRGWEVVVVDDASTDGSDVAVAGWIESHPSCPALMLRHEVNRGLAQARNSGWRRARADLLLMLDSDNVLRSTAMGRLAGALERDPNASFSYGILDRFSTDGPEGLVNVFGWEPARFRTGNYIDALALIRREALEAMGGYSLDPRLALGWEDYDLWARMAEDGRHAVFVPEMIARYRAGHSSMVSVTNISATDAYAAVADHAPILMAGLAIPL
jgi:glycosyltransferase involved in cell wall biosynthesis